MPTTYPTELKFKIICRYVKGESIKALSQNCMFPKAPYINGARNTALSKCQIAPAHLQNLMQWPGG